MLRSFIEKSYYLWKAGQDIRRANEERKFALEIVERQRRQIHDEIEETLEGANMGMWTLVFSDGRAAGMNDHLAKPLDIQKLYRTLARYHRSAYSE